MHQGQLHREHRSWQRITRALEPDSRARSRAFAATGDGRAGLVECGQLDRGWLQGSAERLR